VPGNARSLEAWDIIRRNFGDRLAEKIGRFSPSTAQSEGDIVILNSREFLDDGGGVVSQRERTIGCWRGLGRHEIRLPRIRRGGAL
jgi:hypothetical protein